MNTVALENCFSLQGTHTSSSRGTLIPLLLPKYICVLCSSGFSKCQGKKVHKSVPAVVVVRALFKVLKVIILALRKD